MELITVDSMIKKPFSSRSYDEKLKIVKANKPTPKLSLLSSKYKARKKSLLDILIHHLTKTSISYRDAVLGLSCFAGLACFFQQKVAYGQKLGSRT